MKSETTKPAQHKRLFVTVDPHLDEVFEGKVLFPEKLARANELLAKHPMPERLKKRKA